MQPNGSELAERWDKLLDGRLDDGDRRGLLEAAGAELNQAVAERDGDYGGLLDAIAAVADQPIGERLWADAFRAFELALGANPARLIGWLVVDSTYAERLAAVRPALDPAARAFLTDLLVRFGDRLERASHAAATGNEHDWRLVNREIAVDRTTGWTTVRLTISKYNGEEMRIEGRPDSMLTLAEAMLAAVNAVGDPAAFHQDLGPFMDTVGQTLAMLTVDTGQPNGAVDLHDIEPVASEGAGGPPAPTPYR